MRNRTTTFLVVGALAACSPEADDPTPTPATVAPDATRVAAAMSALHARRSALGLDAAHTFAVRRARVEADGTTHIRVAPQYKGVPILGASASLHLDAAGGERDFTDALARGIDLDTAPKLSAASAIAAAEAALAPAAKRTPSRAQLAILPLRDRVRTVARHAEDLRDNAADYERRTSGYRLVYRVDTDEEQPKQRRYALIDATTGAVVRTGKISRSWDYGAFNTAKTFFSRDFGDVQIHVSGPGPDDEVFQLVDPVREDMMVFDWQDVGLFTAPPMTDNDGTWGDNKSFVPGVTSRKTAGVDAYFGLEVVWDMYGHVFNFWGIDGDGTSIAAGVHDPDLTNNAHFDGSILSFGDSNKTGGTMTPIDVVAHEYTHAVNSETADLDGAEGDGLNEANSDIFGVLTRIYFKKGAHGTASSTIPATTMDESDAFWVLGADLQNGGIRSMFQPRFKYYFSTIGDEDDEHEIAGPMDRAFFFLSQGSKPNVTSRTWSHSLPWGMTGIGNNAAAKIWFRTLELYLQSDDGYAQTRTRTISATQDLFALHGPEEKAVRNAFAGIDVGDPAVDAPAPPQAVTANANIDSEANAQQLTFPSTTPVPGLRKLDVLGLNHTGKDDFQITLACGKSFGARLEATTKYQLAIFQKNNSTALTSDTTGSGDAVISLDSNAGCTGSTTFFVRVLFQGSSTFPPPLYILHLDRQD